MAESYVPYNWTSGEPITQEKMRHIEYGIASAETSALTAKEIANSATTILNRIQSDLTATDDTATRAENLAQQAVNATQAGTNAWTQVQPVITINPETGTVEKSLLSVLGDINKLVTNKTDEAKTDAAKALSDATTVAKWINDAKAVGTVLKEGRYVTADSLAEKITDMDRLIENANTTANSVANTISPINGLTFAERLNALDANTTPSMNVPEIITEISNARGTNSQGGDNISLSQRFTQDETRLTAVENDLSNNVVHKTSTDIKDDLASSDTTLPLSARAGKELRDIIGGSYDPYNQDSANRTTVTSAIDAAKNLAEGNAKGYADALLGNGFTSTNTVTTAITALQNADTTLGNRTTDLETEMTNARTSSVIKDIIEEEDEETHEMVEREVNKTYNNVDERLEAIETHAAAVRADVDTIASELQMTDITDQVVATTSRIDQLESNVVAMANEIGMLQNGAAVEDMQTAITGQSTRIDTAISDITAIQGELNDARIQVGTDPETEAPIMSTLDQRLDSMDSNTTNLSNAIDHVHQDDNDELPDGLTQRLTAAESDLDTLETRIGTVETTANNAATSSQLNALITRVSNLENEPKSATVVIDNTCITYTTSGEAIIPTIYTNNEKTTEITPTQDADYLLQGETPDTKYYYWKYLGESPNGQWALISGGGGSGSGNSNAEDYETYAAFEVATKETNKDYYVLQSDNIRHHYRYLKSVDANDIVTWTRIEIGVPTSMLKSYQIARSQVVDQSTQKATEYLDFYGFNFGTNVSSDDVDTIPNYESYRIARVELPKGGDGGEGSSGHRIYAKVRGDQAQRIAWSTAQNSGVRINYGYTCYSFNEVDGYDYVSLQGTLTDENNNVIETYNVPYLTYADYTEGIANITTKNLLSYCAKNETRSFTLTLHANVPQETIPDKTITVSITLVELALTSTFSDQQTYSINNNLTIPYEFTGMSDQSPSFEILFDNNVMAATVTATNIVIRKESLAGKKGVHNLTIRASQLVGGTTLYSDPLTYQLGLLSGTNDTLMLFSGISLQDLYNEQYKLLKLPYYLYVPNGEKTDVSFVGERLTYNDSHVITNRESVSELNKPTESLGTGSYSYSFRLHDMIADIEYYAVTITAGGQSLVFYITMNKAAEQINIKTDNLMFDFKPERYSNNVENEALRLWSDTNNGVTYKMRIPEGAHFDWRTGGWMTIDDVPCFCVKAGSRVEFVQEFNGNTTPLTLFWQNMETLGGSNFKCTFKIDNVKTPNTPFLTSLDTVTNTIVNYGKTILASKQDIEDDDTLLHTYLNTKYIYTATINSSNKTVKEAIGKTVLNSAPFDNVIDNTARAAAEVDARNSNKKKIKKYISNIYDIANQASTQAHREYLLKKLSGKSNDATIDYSTIKNEITSYLFDEALYDAGNADNTNATNVYNTLVSESNDDTSITYAYRQVEPVNFDALLNGFVVEGKAGKDGIIAMILFTFASTIKTGGTYTQTVSATPISTNSFDKTGTFKVQVTDTVSNETKTYEVDILDEESDGNYTEIISIKDASNTETRAYGLELNALGSNIYLPSGVVSYAHSEGDVIEFEYNVNPEISGRVNSSIIIYEDGVPSAAKLYTSRNGIFEQSNPGCLTIGSDECDVYIYKMRLYSQALNNEDILANFYADGLTTDDMMDRYNRNKNLVNAATITPQLVAEECPDLRIIMIEAPNLTGGKTSFIKNTKIRQIYKKGRPEDNWVALNAYHAGQGTSSDNYGVAGRNLDIMFGFDGVDTVIVPKPQKNNYTFDPTYKSILIKGLQNDLTNDILTAEEYEAAGYTIERNGAGKVSFTEDSVPNNWFNIKVNIASSENTNNAFLQKRFDRYLPYETPAMKRDSKIKNDMEFFNCVIFIKETGTPSEFTEDKDLAASARPWHFYGIGNIGDSKKTDSTRVNVEGDPYEFCIEISDNGLKNSGFSSGVYYISEASKLRSQTPRNQTNGNADLENIRNATSVHVCTDGEFTINDSSYIFSIVDPDDSALYLVPVSTEAFTYYRRFMHISAEWVEIGEPITFTRTSYGIKYPISNAEWTCSLNDYHKSLYDTTSGKGWDKSFEFRYDITTKDGETVARNDLEAAMNELHQQINKKAFADMYSWVVTASNEDFSAEFNTRAVNATSRWFIKESPLYWYLFTERYTMIDSRAKNTFYHYGKVFISQEEYDGDLVAELTTAASDPAAYATEHNITANGNVTAEAIAAEEIQFRLNAAQFVYNNRDTFTLDDTQAAINDGYRFELWDYDNDTALGINNNGQMVFSAGLEDVDKDISGWIYNEAESVLWRRIRENTYDDLGALYVRLKGTGFNAENLIQEFDTLQAQFPEELWRLDFERKYYRPFISKGETTYLNDMANGRKKYQRRQFERNMAIYINSKYQRNGAYDENDIISFRPQFTWTAGRNTQITVKPYSTMYINFMLGNDDQTGQSISERVQRGESYVIDAADYIHDFNNIQCIIYNASRIMELDGLGNFECKQFILGAAKKLSVLKLGSVEYPNRSMADINNMGLSDGLPLLEELDLTNIQFGTAPDTFALDNFPLLKKLNATGCNIRSFTFKDGGMLEKIIFPAVLTRIDFQNLYKLIDTYNDQNELESAVILTGAANLISYNSVNSYTNSYQIVQNMLNNAGQNGITQLKLNDIVWTINDLIELEPLTQLQQKLGNNMVLQGTITVTGNWSQVKLNDYKSIFGASNITWNVNVNNQVPEFKLSFYLSSDDVNDESKLYYSKYVSPNEGESNIVLGEDPVYNGDCHIPTKDPTISKTYYFGTNKSTYYPWTGWRIANSSEVPYAEKEVTNNMNFVAIFSEEGRKYPLHWYLTNDPTDTPVKTVQNITYGGSYDDGIAPTVLDLKKANRTTYTFNSPDGVHCNYSIFKGWERSPINMDSTFLNSAQDAFCIYGEWEEGTNIDINTLKAQESLDAKKLLMLSNIAGASSTLPINSTLDVEMGYDVAGGTTIVGKGATMEFGSGLARKTYDENNIVNFEYYYNNNNQLSMNPAILNTSTIKPFEDMTNRGFTLAIDYRVDTQYLSEVYQNGYAIICGCYSGIQDGSSSGFAIYYDIAGGIPKICFGDLSSNSTYTTNSAQNLNIADANSANTRNIVVIRHQAGSNTLQIYTGINSDNGILTALDGNLFERTITWSNNSFNAPLCFGHFTSSTFNSVSTVRSGIGTNIYWAKYWDSDLGKDECVHLASWPHEKLTFVLEDYTNDHNQDVIVTTANNLVFSALQVSQYGGPRGSSYSTSSGTTAIWGYELNNSGNSFYKKIANERFFSGLPITLQSIIEKTPSGAVLGQITHTIAGDYYKIVRTENTVDLAFLPTYVEAGGSDYNGSYSGEAYTVFPWRNAANSNVYSYNNNSFAFDSPSHSAEYMNLRFFGIPINHRNNVVYINYNEAAPVYNKITASDHAINRGDIFIYTETNDNTTITTAYIYANTADVNAGAPIIRRSSGDLLYCPAGGWIEARSWWTRSISAVASDEFSQKATSQPFYYVEGHSGGLADRNVPTNGQGAYFVYSFGI